VGGGGGRRHCGRMAGVLEMSITGLLIVLIMVLIIGAVRRRG
jgi:hypothetical protein